MTGRVPSEGHRALPHTADARLEAWGGNFAACVGEAVRALVEVFAEPSGAPVHEVITVAFEGEGPDEVLLEALDEVIYRLDVDGTVPIGFQLAGDRTRLTGEFAMARLADVEVVGPEPKAVARSGLEVETGPDGTVTARVTVDV